MHAFSNSRITSGDMSPGDSTGGLVVLDCSTEATFGLMADIFGGESDSEEDDTGEGGGEDSGEEGGEEGRSD